MGPLLLAVAISQLLPCKSVAQEFHDHQRLVDGAHAHALGDVLPEALVGGGKGAGAWGDGGGVRRRWHLWVDAPRRSLGLPHPLGQLWPSAYDELTTSG